jgi:hypothetical protein
MERTRSKRLRLLIFAAAAFGCSSASLSGTLAIFGSAPAQAAAPAALA